MVMDVFSAKAKGSSAAAFRFEPDKLIIWLYSGLLDVVEQIFTKNPKKNNDISNPSVEKQDGAEQN